MTSYVTHGKNCICHSCEPTPAPFYVLHGQNVYGRAGSLENAERLLEFALRQYKNARLVRPGYMGHDPFPTRPANGRERKPSSRPVPGVSVERDRS